MADKVSPSYARGVLGEALRDRRLELGLSQAEVARWLGQHQPKIVALEKAQLKRIKMAELNVILDKLGIDGEHAEELRSYARTPYEDRGAHLESAGRQSWWGGRARAERMAVRRHSYHALAWDGLVQEQSYMRRRFELTGTTDINAATRGRLARQKAAFEAERPAEFRFVVHEAALDYSMGDAAMLTRQLEHVDKLLDHPNIKVQVIPTDASLPPQLVDFTICEFESYVMSDLVLVEFENNVMVIDDDDSLRDYRRIWNAQHGGALSEYDSRQLIRARISHGRAQEKEK